MNNNTFVVSLTMLAGWLCFLFLWILFSIKRSNGQALFDSMTQTMATWQMRTIITIMVVASVVAGIYFAVEWLKHGERL